MNKLCCYLQYNSDYQLFKIYFPNISYIRTILRQKHMKKLLILCCLFLFQNIYSQFFVETHSGDPILDGSTWTYGVFGVGVADLPFYVYNSSASDDIYMKIQFVSAENADGSLAQLCFGLCYEDLVIGSSYPPGAETVIINPGENQGFPGDKISNLSDGNGNSVEYVFRFYQVDENGDPIGGSEDLTMTYRYDPNLSSGDNKPQLALMQNLVSEQLNVTAQERLGLDLYTLQGKHVGYHELNQGNQSIDVSALASSVYLVVATNDIGQQKTFKIIKR